MANTAMQDFLKAWNAGQDIQVTEGGSAYKESLLKVLGASIQPGNNEHENPLMHYPEALFLVFKLGVQAGDHKGISFESVQRVFLDDKGSLTNPVVKSYVKKDGTLQANSLAYDILEAARENGDDRFGSIDITNKEKANESFKGLVFKMGLKKGVTKDGRDFYILNTHYQQLKDDEYRKNQAGDQSFSAGEKETVRGIDPDDLPF